MARKNIEMSPDEVDAFLNEGWNLQVSTIGQGGWPHLTTLWYTIHNGMIVFRSFRRSQRIVNLTRNPKVAVLVEDGKAYGELRGVMVQGTAELVEDRDTILEVYGAVASKYQFEGTPIDPAQLETLFGQYADKNTAVLIHPVRIASWDHRKLAGAY